MIIPMFGGTNPGAATPGTNPWASTTIPAEQKNGRGPEAGTNLPPMKSRSGPARNHPRPGSRHLMVLQAVWLIFLCVLGAWWVSLMFSQAGRIASLEQQAGIDALDAQKQWLRTQRMLVWEGGTFFGALLFSLGLLAWFHWRDTRRARTLQAFFASVTHELRTPLASIRLESEALADVLPAASPGRPLVDRMLEDSARLESQVERALELARLEGGGGVLTRPVNLRPIVAEFLRNWRPPPGRTVEIQNLTAEVGAIADPGSIHTLLRNLIENSVRHSRANPLRITISTYTSGPSTVLSVSDHGSAPTGLPGKLGSLFARGADSAGAGVGLYLTRQLMRRMGGEARFVTGADGFTAELAFESEVADG